MWYVTATNGGFSATILPNGDIDYIGERGAAEPVDGMIWLYMNEIQTPTFYQKYGDGYALLFAIMTLALALLSRYSGKKKTEKNRAGE
jgi:apolipoprotein N-acyltransferase